MIVIEPYSSRWPEVFQALKSCFERHLGDYIFNIEHVGSTSVPGLKAKPILDIDIVTEADADKLGKVILVLSDLGYQHRGDLGITGREAFRRLSEKTPDDGSGRIWHPHHLYVCPQGNPALENHLRLRNYLRTHPEAAQAYGALKAQLARDFPEDMDAYIEGKTAFIAEILRKTGMKEEWVADIVEQNRAG